MRLAFFALALASLASAAAAAETRRPNVLLIVADDLGYADVGFHGCKDIPTPNLDTLAKEGTRFSCGYVSGPYCSPTRAGLLTGRYQQRFGHEFNPGPAAEGKQEIGLSLKEKTLADRLKTAGYQTGLVGKWHLGNAEKFRPMARGFDEFFGFLGGAHDYFKPGAGPNGIFRGNKPAGPEGYLTDAFTREAVDFIDRHQKEPFFLYLAFNAVHTPLQASDKYLKRFEAIKDEKRRKYAAMLSAMDDAVGEVLGKVKAAGLEEDTLVFFISDNGGPPVNGSDNGPLHGHKATTWEGGIRVPFVVKWKGKVPAGKVYDKPVIQLDLTATALSAAGAKLDPDYQPDGVDLLPYIAGDKTGEPHAALYWRFGAQIAVRSGDWKLVKATEPGTGAGGRKGEASPEGARLFNLADDIGEKTDLASKNPEKAKELASLWEKWNSGLVKPAWGAPRAAKKAE
jgi:arylsulfatase A-like enzyme